MANEVLATPSNTIISIDFPEPVEKVVAIGTLQDFAYQSQRAKTPIPVIGSKVPITIAKGQRTIAGNMTGVVLDKSFQFMMIMYFWYINDSNRQEQTYREPVVHRITGRQELNDIYGSVDNFLNNIAVPILTSLGYDDPSDLAEQFGLTQNRTAQLSPTPMPLLDYAKLPPIYLDEVPPLKLVLITPFEYEKDPSTQQVVGMKYEKITFYGLEFLNNDYAVSAGREAIFESVNFIQRSVSRSIDTSYFGQ